MKNIAIVQFGSIDEVNQAYAGMCKKKQEEGYTVRFIDMLNLSNQDLIFLKSKELHQINIVGHSATWDEKGYIIPMDHRKIGSVSMKEACDRLHKLAKVSHARKFNFYPCEIADKFLDIEEEMRDKKALDGIFRQEVEEYSIDDLSTLENKLSLIEKNSSKSISSFDRLSLAILRGRSQHGNVSNQPVFIGGQVGPGDPKMAKNVGSPRGSVPRELARQLQTANKKSRPEIIDQINKIQKIQSKQQESPVTWVEKNVRLFKAYEVVEKDNKDISLVKSSMYES